MAMWKTPAFFTHVRAISREFELQTTIDCRFLFPSLTMFPMTFL